MQRISPSLITAILVGAFIFSASDTRSEAQADERKTVENVVRAFEQAVEEFDFAKAESWCTSDARWIEESYPKPMNPWPKWLMDAKEAEVHIDYHPQDFEIHVKGDVAWVTVTLKSTFKAETEAGKRLLGGNSEWHPIFVESEILLRTPGGWKIALGHTTHIPENKPK